jgi:hypothetical protein
MRFFYDWEFLEDGKTIEPISLGIVAENGNWYYGVNADMPLERIGAHDWLAKNVVPHLPVETGTLDVISEYFRKGLKFSETDPLEIDLDMLDDDIQPLARITREVERFFTENLDDRETELWANFGAYDHLRLMQLWGPMMERPFYLPMYTNDLQQLWRTKGFPDLPQQDRETQHHSLHDARHDQVLFNHLAKLPNKNWPEVN